MEEALLEIIAALDAGQDVDAAWLDKLVRRHNRAARDGTRRVAKRRLLPFYLKVKADDPKRWRSWNVGEATDAALMRLLQAKPRRTASGVATIAVLTKPWPCSGACVFCPSDIRMPKSYLADEPACQRAERCWFDPYLQVTARLRALTAMGHVTDKVELIVLGGTWSDYPEGYQRWFIGELFAALNASDEQRESEATFRCRWYERRGLPRDPEALSERTADVQKRINTGELTYNEAWKAAYGQARTCADAPNDAEGDPTSSRAACSERSTRPGDQDPFSHCGHDADEKQRECLSWEALFARHRANETAAKRVVGLVVETRPDLVTPESCRILRALGCTKVQIGIQSLNDDLLAVNGRAITAARIARAMACLRLWGFKSHVHFMANLLGATPAGDIDDYARLVTDERFLPDEVKLYPCCLVESARLTEAYERGQWRPYTEEELVGVLAADMLATPPWTRISRMIRDISATDILVGNKKTNLRQIVDAAAQGTTAPMAPAAPEAKSDGAPSALWDAESAPEDAPTSKAAAPAVREIRSREISVEGASLADLALETIAYRTSNTEERFLQWVTSEDKIAGFCRLSLPDQTLLPEHASTLISPLDTSCPDNNPHPRNEDSSASDSYPFPMPGEAMIREVHAYGKVAALHRTGEGTQHLGLGRALVEEACRQAAEAGYGAVNVISAVGTRVYYRNLGFTDAGLYQRRPL